MYFPYRFNQKLAIELGMLVEQAYMQFDCYENKSAWLLSEEYRLLSEITLDANSIRNDKTFQSMMKFVGVSEKSNIRIPIGFIAEKGNNLYTIFRGTKTPKEWISNFTVILKEYSISGFGEVHNGFLDMYDSLQKTIIDILSSCKRSKSLYIAGHSLGAALATLAVPDINKNAICNIKAVYLFGSPRVGDDSFVKAYNDRYGKKTFRIVNTSDIVTSIPFPIPIIGPLGGYFSHIDTPVDFTRQENDIVNNHKMATYLEELRNEKEGMIKRILRGGA